MYKTLFGRDQDSWVDMAWGCIRRARPPEIATMLYLSTKVRGMLLQDMWDIMALKTFIYWRSAVDVRRMVREACDRVALLHEDWGADIDAMMYEKAALWAGKVVDIVRRRVENGSVPSKDIVDVDKLEAIVNIAASSINLGTDRYEVPAPLRAHRFAVDWAHTYALYFEDREHSGLCRGSAYRCLEMQAEAEEWRESSEGCGDEEKSGLGLALTKMANDFHIAYGVTREQRENEKTRRHQ